LNIPKPLSRFFGVLVMLAFILAIPGMSACQDSAYKVMAVNEGIQGFSFEYPQNYSLIRLDLRNDSTYQYTQLGLSATEGANYSEIYAYLWYPGQDTSTADVIMDQLLAGAATMTDYALVSRTTTMIGDTIAQQAVFAADSSQPITNPADSTEVPPDTTSTPSRPATYRITCMIYGGIAIEIDMTCDQSLTDITKDDYQHVLDTFQIVD
jgi:hypothetical protein